MFEAFWWNNKNRERTGNRPAHIVARSYETENEAGCLGDIYVSYCGEEMESWDYAPFEKGFGTLEEAVKDGADVCSKCLRLKTEKESEMVSSNDKSYEHPNESRDQRTFNDWCTCDSPSVPGYATGGAYAICRRCGGKVSD